MVILIEYNETLWKSYWEFKCNAPENVFFCCYFFLFSQTLPGKGFFFRILSIGLPCRCLGRPCSFITWCSVWQAEEDSFLANIVSDVFQENGRCRGGGGNRQTQALWDSMSGKIRGRFPCTFSPEAFENYSTVTFTSQAVHGNPCPCHEGLPLHNAPSQAGCQHTGGSGGRGKCTWYCLSHLWKFASYSCLLKKKENKKYDYLIHWEHLQKMTLHSPRLLWLLTDFLFIFPMMGTRFRLLRLSKYLLSWIPDKF